MVTNALINGSSLNMPSFRLKFLWFCIQTDSKIFRFLKLLHLNNIWLESQSIEWSFSKTWMKLALLVLQFLTLLLCSFSLTSKDLPVSPIYTKLQSLQGILYTPPTALALKLFLTRIDLMVDVYLKAILTSRSLLTDLTFSRLFTYGRHK